jgi:hypothetical protein
MSARIRDDWYDREDSTRDAMIAELQRITRRFRARPLRVLALASMMSTAIIYALATRAVSVEAEVVLALTEGALSADKHHGIPADNLREYVEGVLITDAKLARLIERRDLYPSRRKLGMPYAIEQLRGRLAIDIWKNSFADYDEDTEHSARIGITFTDSDPDRAYVIARDLAAIVIETAQEQRLDMNTRLARAIEVRRDGLAHHLGDLTRTTAENHAAFERARRSGDNGLAQTLQLQLIELAFEQKAAKRQLSEIATSRDTIADRIAASGLDTRIAVVEENRPNRPQHRDFLIAMAAIVIAVGSLVGSALLLGAFDSRVHDADDIGRLGLAVLGHVPAFPGDHEGSLRTRGVPPSLATQGARWRSPR